MKLKIIYFVVFCLVISCKSAPKIKESEPPTNSSPSHTEEEHVTIEYDDLVPNIHEDARFNFVIDDSVPNPDLNEKIRKLFEAIEEKIATGDFSGWYNALSYKHKKYISDKTVLSNMSRESDYLYSRNIVLENPKDYFLNIVMPSRKGYSLKYINYEKVNANHLKVNCVLDGAIKFVYDFVNEDGSWKVDRK